MKTADNKTRKEELNEVKWSVDHIPRVSCAPFLFNGSKVRDMCIFVLGIYLDYS